MSSQEDKLYELLKREDQESIDAIFEDARDFPEDYARARQRISEEEQAEEESAAEEGEPEEEPDA